MASRQFFRIKVQHQRRLRGDKATDKPGRKGQLSADRVGDKGGKHRDGEAEQQPAERFGQIGKFQYREIETGEFARVKRVENTGVRRDLQPDVGDEL